MISNLAEEIIDVTIKVTPLSRASFE